MTAIELPRSIQCTDTHYPLERGASRSIEGHSSTDPRTPAALDGTPTPVGQTERTPHSNVADGNLSAGAIPPTGAHSQLAPATQRAAAMPLLDAHKSRAAVPQLPDAKLVLHTHNGNASGTPPADGHRTIGTQLTDASAPNFGDDPQRRRPVADPPSAGSHAAGGTHTAIAPGGWLRDPVLGVLADVVDDLEKVRIANANRVRQLTRTATDSDGEDRGFGLTLDHPEVAKLALTVKALAAAEHDAILNLQRALRKHALVGFQKRHKGIGEKQLARLLAVLGDPYWNDLHQRPRTVSELWAYAGFHVIKPSGSGHSSNDDQVQLATAGTQPHTGSHLKPDTQTCGAPGVAPKRQRGQKSNWSEAARKRVWVIASSMPKFPGGHYEQVYRAARAKYEGSVHAIECVRCGPKGKPAPVGSPRADGHNHAMSIRIVAKEILKDLWIEARDLYDSSYPADSAPGVEAVPPAAAVDVATGAGGASHRTGGHAGEEEPLPERP